MNRRIPRRVPADLAWIVAISLLFLLALIAHHRFRQADFKSYYFAAEHLLAGRPVYFAPPYYFVYAPAVALLFVPLRAVGLLPAMVAWYAINTALIWILWRRLAGEMGPLRRGTALVFFLAIGFALERELHVGNVNLLNLALCVTALGLVRRTAASGNRGPARPAADSAARGPARPAAGGLVLASAILIKPQNGLLLLPLARRQPRILPVVGGALALQALLPLPFCGVAGTVELHRQFLKMVLAFNQDSARLGFFKYSATTAGLLNRALNPLLPGDRHVPLLVAGLLIAVALILLVMRKARDPLDAGALALALVPLTAVSDYQFFMFAAPLIYLLLRRRESGRLSRAQRWCLAGSLFIYGGNWHDLWGDRLSRLFLDLGVHGFGTWCLIGVFLWVMFGRDDAATGPAAAGRPREAVSGARPPVVVSACLLGQAVRYDGGHRRSEPVAGALSQYYEWVPVCPEMEIGLRVPREPIRLESAGGAPPGEAAPAAAGALSAAATPGHPRLVSLRSRRDLTTLMEEHARRRADALAAAGIRGFIFKKNSPSCGPGGVPVFPAGTAAGVFARILVDRLPGLPVVDEERLEDPAARQDFIARVAAYQPLKRSRIEGT